MVKPEVRSFEDDAGNAIKGVALDLLKTILTEIFGGSSSGECDPFYMYRSRLVDMILKSMKSSKGSYMIYDPSSSYYERLMYNPMLRSMPPLPQKGVVLADSPSPTDSSSSAIESSLCQSNTRGSPIIDKFLDYLMNAPFMPKKAKELYNTGLVQGGFRIGRELLRIMGRGIMILARPSLHAPDKETFDRMVRKNVEDMKKVSENSKLQKAGEFFFIKLTLHLIFSSRNCRCF